MRACLLLFLLSGCTSAGPRILVIVDSPLAVTSELDFLEIWAAGQGETPSDIRGLPLRPPGPVDVDAGVTRHPLPTSFAVAPRPGRTAIELGVDGMRGGTAFTHRHYVITDLVPGELRVLGVVIDRSCDVCPTETVSFRALRRVDGSSELDGAVLDAGTGE